MAVDLILTPSAAYDIDESYAWYEARREGLGEQFLNTIKASIRMIVQSPELFPKVRKQYRRMVVRRFPFCIFYEYFNDTVVIYGVIHTSIDPQRWVRRLP